MGGNSEFQVQDSFFEYFFWRFGDLENELHFLKKKIRGARAPPEF